MSISTLTFDRKLPYILISLAVFMLVFAGSQYSHSPEHPHIHTADRASSANVHQHIQLSGDTELGVDSLLHCGADILGEIGTKKASGSIKCSPKYKMHYSALNAYQSTVDPPPPRLFF